ncbi:hypothetical protein E3N88_15823 [Mikania micrantha]|uniref:Uncharacterized protein n=1 Tax=Mikania micrantha TaxID=192012 RepID=A0A5N6NYR5_9ASTR|nr:hypothetical protein E3N88_15823 [Mikania micrantha]
MTRNTTDRTLIRVPASRKKRRSPCQRPGGAVDRKLQKVGDEFRGGVDCKEPFRHFFCAVCFSKDGTGGGGKLAAKEFTVEGSPSCRTNGEKGEEVMVWSRVGKGHRCGGRRRPEGS